jgi:hypothetical protein
MKWIRLLLSACCLFFGVRLLFAAPEVMDLYKSWGYSVFQMRFAGLTQVLAAFLVWIPRLQIFSLLMIWGIVATAFSTHWRLQQEWIWYLPGLVVGGLVLLLFRRPKLSTATESFDPNSPLATQSATQVCPEGFEDQPFEIKFKVNAAPAQVSGYLNSTSTFTDGQIFPFRVEFLDAQTRRFTREFKEGILTNHHGPLLNAAGVLQKIEFPRYRDLQYFYGSYAISFRLFRPYRLEIWVDEDAAAVSSIVSVKLSTYVRRGWAWLWTVGQTCFWPSFTARRFQSGAVTKRNQSQKPPQEYPSVTIEDSIVSSEPKSHLRKKIKAAKKLPKQRLILTILSESMNSSFLGRKNSKGNQTNRVSEARLCRASRRSSICLKFITLRPFET